VLVTGGLSLLGDTWPELPEGADFTHPGDRGRVKRRHNNVFSAFGDVNRRVAFVRAHPALADVAESNTAQRHTDPASFSSGEQGPIWAGVQVMDLPERRLDVPTENKDANGRKLGEGTGRP
jgi:hypothetical protein